MASKHHWIISTLRTINAQDPKAIGLSETHFKILEQNLYVDPNQEMTPFQKMINRYQTEQKEIQEKRAMIKQQK